MGGDDIENGVAVTGESLLRIAGSSSVFAGSPSKREENPLRAFGLRGRLGVRYLAVQDRTGFGQDFSQPALDLRLEGRDLGGTAFEVLADVRTRRTYRTSSLGDHTTEGRSRVYRASVGLAPSQGRLALRVGRQFAAELPSLGIYDGVAASVRGERWSLGILSGTQPNGLTFGYSSMVREHAGFFQLRANRDARQVWSVTAGVVASYADGIINREYLAAQTTASLGPVFFHVSQDVDLNRNWKYEVEGEHLSPTNTYASLRVQVARNTAVTTGFDNRRTVRLYRDHISPETEFDDAFRQGVWAGVSQRFDRIYRTSFRVKRSSGGAAENADSFTLSASAQWPVALRARSTRYINAMLDGWVHSGAASVQLRPSLRFELGGGIRRETVAADPGGALTIHWTSVLLDQAIGRNWYMSVSMERASNGPSANDQFFSILSYRF